MGRPKWWQEVAGAPAGVPLPWRISGCAAWWDLDDASISGGLVQSVTDKVGGYVAGTALGAKPVSDTTTLPGHILGTSATFDRGLSCTDAALLTAVNSISGGYTFVTYGRNSSGTAGQLMLGPHLSDDGGTDFRGLTWYRSLGLQQWRWFDYTAGFVQVTSTNGTTAFSPWIVTYESAVSPQLNVYRPGVSSPGPIDALGAGTCNLVALRVGFSSVATWNGVYGLFTRPLNATERSIVLDYLTAKYA